MARHLPRHGVMGIRTGALLAAALVVAVLFPTPAGAESPRIAVVELFTSQGCSSCPPADALLGELAERPAILALTFNVDYWDYLGWKDTLASPMHSKRQRKYAKRRGDSEVYTPQMVVNGRLHVVGSRREAVQGAIEEQLARPESTFVRVGIERDGNEVVVTVAGAPADRLAPDATVWLAMISPKVGVEIDRGENRGKRITYTNVVRRMIPIGMWRGEPVTVRLPASEIVTDDGSDCAALLQVDKLGPILGATGVVDLLAAAR